MVSASLLLRLYIQINFGSKELTECISYQSKVLIKERFLIKAKFLSTRSGTWCACVTLLILCDRGHVYRSVVTVLVGAVIGGASDEHFDEHVRNSR